MEGVRRSLTKTHTHTHTHIYDVDNASLIPPHQQTEARIQHLYRASVMSLLLCQQRARHPAFPRTQTEKKKRKKKSSIVHIETVPF
jgi:hypothetical protein